MKVQCSALGTPRLFLDGEEIVQIFRSPSRCALLFVIALEGEITRPALMAMFWPDSDEDRARHTLSQTLYLLRKDLGGEVLASDGEMLRLAGGAEVDVHRFRQLLREGDLAGARAVYRGTFMAGSYLSDTRAFEGWVDGWRARVAQDARDLFATMVRQANAAQRPDAALDAARSWVQHDALDDLAQAALIEALARTGQRGEALRQYQSYAELLREELDMDTLDEIEALVARIRAGSLPPTGGEADAFGQGESSHLQIIRVLGRGATAEVYLARESGLRRLVAVKVLRREFMDDRTALARFEREARAAARIHHPNVAPVYRTGKMETGAPFLITPYIKWGTLAERLARDPTWKPDARVLVAQVAAGLAAAHAAGVVHRDVRPGNILLAEDDERAMLTDFGLAAVLATGHGESVRLTRTGEILGNPTYMAPEQISGDPVTDRTDVYGLGVTAYELLEGVAPFSGQEADVLAMHLEEPPPPFSRTHGELGHVVSACLEKRPASRPSAAEVHRAFRS